MPLRRAGVLRPKWLSVDVDMWGDEPSLSVDSKAMWLPHNTKKVMEQEAAEESRHRDACYQHYSYGLLDQWLDTGVPFCGVQSLTAGRRTLFPDAASAAPLIAAARSLPHYARLAGYKLDLPLEGAREVRGPGGQAGSSREWLRRAFPAPGTPAAAADQLDPTREAAGLVVVDGVSSALMCRVTQDGHLPAPTAPHTFCDGRNLAIDFRRLKPAKCPRHRPGYMCAGDPVFHHYDPGFLAGSCARESPFKLQSFPKDHLRDIFGSMEFDPKPFGKAVSRVFDTPLSTADVDVAAAPVDASLGADSTTPVGLAALERVSFHGAIAPEGHPDAKATGDISQSEASALVEAATAGSGALSEGAVLPISPAPVVLFVTRERDEHANLFHTTTDFMNAFFSLHMAGVIDAHGPGELGGTEAVMVVILDDQKPAPFDTVWSHVFAPVFGAHRVGDFVAHGEGVLGVAGGLGGALSLLGTSERSNHATDNRISNLALPGPRTLVPHAIFSPPGYTNVFLANLFKEGDCRRPTGLLRSFREFFLRGLGIVSTQPAHRPNGFQGLRILFISRRPYTEFVNHKSVGRQVDNEDEVVTALRQLDGVERVEQVDFVKFTYLEQVAMVANTDLMVGMHGAALTHGVLLPPWAGLLELWPKPDKIWQCFEHSTEMSGPLYRRWANSKFPRNYREDKQGDYTVVNVQEVRAIALEMVTQIKARIGRIMHQAGGLD